MWISFRAGTSDGRVLFVVPKSVGTAVTRNRVRRRVREALRELRRDGAVALGAGTYRLGVSSSLADMTFPDLRSVIVKLFGEVAGSPR